MFLRSIAPFAAALSAGLAPLHAWDYQGHRIVNQLALAGLPGEFPAFVREPAAAERIAFLSGEPDRWRNTDQLPLRHVNGPDHFLDIEYLADAGMPVSSLGEFRYVYTVDFAAAHASHPEKFPPVDPAKNQDRTRELIGYLPWTVAENYAKLKSAFSYLQAYEEAGTPDEIANAQANILYIMGVLGHYVGDGAQPLHTTKHYNGWVGDNPHGYTRSSGIHAWIDGGFVEQFKLSADTLLPRARPAREFETASHSATARNPVFAQTLDWLVLQHAQVEPLYRLEKDGLLKPGASDGGAAGRALLEEQFLRGGEFLSSLWLTAWKQAGPDSYLRALLKKRSADPSAP